jgi:hypothetical protein
MTATPPRPPLGIQVKLKDDQIVVGSLWQKWAAPLATVTVQALDNAGAKKRVVTLVFSAPDGATRQRRVDPAFADRTVAWAAAFNAWQQAVHPR